MNPKISVLIPVYGVEKYIERCAESLFSQTMHDGIEFIFVNDATTDRSMEILDNVIERHPERQGQITIIEHEQNKGIAVARVTGVLAAKGEYVAHCDSDDWVEPSIYEKMYQYAVNNNSDIVVCGYISEYGSESISQHQSLSSTKEETVSSMLMFGEMHPFLWMRLIKRSFYVKNQFFADPKITFCEDLVVTIPMHLSTEKVSVVPECLFHYNVMNVGSMTHERSLKKIESCKLATDFIEEFILKHGYESVLNSLYHLRCHYLRPLIISMEIYNPKRWLEYDNKPIPCDLMARTRFSIWLVRHRLFGINKLVQVIVKTLFDR